MLFTVMLIFYFLNSISCVEEHTQKDFFLSGCECGFALIIVTIKSYMLEMEIVDSGAPSRIKKKARPDGNMKVKLTEGL